MINSTFWKYIDAQFALNKLSISIYTAGSNDDRSNTDYNSHNPKNRSKAGSWYTQYDKGFDGVNKDPQNDIGVESDSHSTENVEGSGSRREEQGVIRLSLHQFLCH